MKALIVGGRGQLGTTLNQTVPDSIDILSLDLPEFDITNPNEVAALVENQKPDVIINASAYTAVDRAEEEADIAFAVNATGPLNLAEAARKNGARIIHISTDYVFDGKACFPYSPEAGCSPLGVYGQSKRQGEIDLMKVIEDSLIIRTSWLYSPYGSNFVLTMLRLMNARDEIRVVADQVGAPTCALTLATAIWAAVAKKHLKGIYHWSDAGVASWYDFAVAICEAARERGLIDRAVSIRPIMTRDYPTPAGRPAYSVLDCTQTWNDLEVIPDHWSLVLKRMLELMARGEKVA